MENVYVIKVKTKPPLSSLYPSERRYSASTVGGLSLVHFGLGALSLLLGTLALSLQGPILSIACLVPFVTGLLAWRRWYIDRNIAIFFYGSLFSLIVAILCFAATVFDLTAVTEDGLISSWTMQRTPENLFHLEENSTIKDQLFPREPSEENYRIKNQMIDKSQEEISNVSSGQKRFENISDGFNFDNNSKEEASIAHKKNLESVTNESLDSIDRSSKMRDRVMSFWQGNNRETSHTKTLLTVNLLVAALLEIFWSLLSARIALRGMMNRLPETGYCNNVASQPEITNGPKRKAPPPRPDILDHDRMLTESLRHVSALQQSFRSNGPKLPLPESTREFRERVERFLANQAAHRVVEGSCT